ncbi:MAG: (d)CMP kinase [Lachnospiraceae bacterium]|nr:(d)CMP kinase [Lachnospiraceae bacterium]
MNANIAIDGPAGAGKSTIAKRLAARLGLLYVDTGAMYRALAVFFLRRGLERSDEEGISQAVADADVTIRYEDGSQQVYLNGENVTGLLRTEETGNMASASSAYGAVRARLLDLQRLLARESAVVMDGRDIGTVILPDALLKIYLTASVEERARRRIAELEAGGGSVDPDQIRRDIEERDRRDMNRAVAPLRQAEDAVLVDSSDMTIDEVVGTIAALYEERCRR